MKTIMNCEIKLEEADNGYVVTVSKYIGDTWHSDAVFVGAYFYETFDSAMRQVKGWYREQVDKAEAMDLASILAEIAVDAVDEEGTDDE
jgi:hypothetical protein